MQISICLHELCNTDVFISHTLNVSVLIFLWLKSGSDCLLIRYFLVIFFSPIKTDDDKCFVHHSHGVLFFVRLCPHVHVMLVKFFYLTYTVNLSSEMAEAKHVSKTILFYKRRMENWILTLFFWGKSWHAPLNQALFDKLLVALGRWVVGKMTMISFLDFAFEKDQYAYFSDTWFLSTKSKSKFTVWMQFLRQMVAWHLSVDLNNVLVCPLLFWVLINFHLHTKEKNVLNREQWPPKNNL